MPHLEPLVSRVLQGPLPQDTARARSSPQGYASEPYRCRQGTNLGSLLCQLFEQSGQEEAGWAPGIPHSHLPLLSRAQVGERLMLQGLLC